jgi:hypothetical protein
MTYGTFVGRTHGMPQGEHWAIVEVRSVTIPSDERSRQAPGHGYPEHVEEMVNYEVFKDEDTFKTELEQRFRDSWHRDQIRGIHVTEMFAPVVKIEVQQS